MSRDGFLRLTTELLFPVVFIAFPAAFTLFLRPRGTDAASSLKRRRLLTTLWVATVALVAAVAIAWAAGYGEFGRWGWTAFFPLWFGLAMPAVGLANRDWGPRPTPPVRAARLTPRPNPPVAPVWVTRVAVLAFLGVCGFGPALLSARSAPAGRWLTFLLLVAGAAGWLGVALFASARSFREPEPLPPNPSPGLERAYDDFRLWLRRCFYWFGLAGAALFAVLGVVGGTGSAPGWLIGLVGGLIGSAFGVGGGIAGTAGSLKRARLNGLYREAVGPDHASFGRG